MTNELILICLIQNRPILFGPLHFIHSIFPSFLVVDLDFLMMMLSFYFVSRRLDGVVFECGCDIRWIQLWLQRGEAGLHTQELYCKNGASKIRLHNMYIHNCGKARRGGRERV